MTSGARSVVAAETTTSTWLGIEDLDSVRERFGFDQVAVLGHSWGGCPATYDP
jgi:pimeloyl-ACP methyl ester carboxylesterase